MDNHTLFVRADKQGPCMECKETRPCKRTREGCLEYDYWIELRAQKKEKIKLAKKEEHITHGLGEAMKSRCDSSKSKFST